jgi:[ribosomal protein S5]-alanine N-acetyltransferase
MLWAMHPPGFPATIPPLVGATLRLGELSEDDIPSWFERARDRESADLAGDPVPSSIDEGAAWLQRHRARFRSKLELRWAIVPKDGAVSVGTVGLVFEPGVAASAELGIVVARSCWGRGIGTTAARMVVGYAFAELGLTEVRAVVVQRNHASVRLLEKCGFSLLEVVPPSVAEPEVLLRYARTRRATVGDRERPSVPAP